MGAGSSRNAGLMRAAAEGDVERVHRMLRRQQILAAINDYSDDGHSPLYWAVSKAHPEVVRALLDRGALVNQPVDRSTNTSGTCLGRGDPTLRLCLTS
jgi:ankyrin repeat protein